MCCSPILETLISPEEQENDALGEIVELLCSIPGYGSIVPVLSHDESPNIRFMTVDCGRVGIVWKVEMWRNCRFKKICRYKRLCRPIRKGNRRSKTFLVPIKTWQAPLCDEIIRLHRLGRLREDWWNYPILLTDILKDTRDDYDQESGGGSYINQAAAIPADYPLPATHDSTANTFSTTSVPESSHKLKVKKMRACMRMAPMMRTMTKLMLMRIVIEMRSMGSLKVMRKGRMGTLGMLRKRVMRTAAMLTSLKR